MLQRNRAARSPEERLRVQAAAALRSWWKAYQRALEKDPIQTKALTSCIGLILADCIAQAADPGAYDLMRTARMATFGLLWHGASVRIHGKLCAPHFWAFFRVLFSEVCFE
jgi:hypothetical protein